VLKNNGDRALQRPIIICVLGEERATQGCDDRDFCLNRGGGAGSRLKEESAINLLALTQTVRQKGFFAGGGGGAVSRFVHKSAGRMNIHKSGGNSGCAI